MERLKNKTCKQCGGLFRSRDKKAAMCSRSCAAKSGKGKTGIKPKHGGCVGGKLSAIYKRWAGMVGRCHSPSNSRFKKYGALGIAVCSEWKRSFKKFETWAIQNGFSQALQIDRVDGTKGYSPENCRWVTPSQNSRNRKDNTRLSDGRLLADVAEKIGISRNTLRHRLKTGISEAIALRLPITPNGGNRKHFESYIEKWEDS